MAEACGWAGLLACGLLPLARDRRRILALQLASGPAFLLHWLLRGDWLAAGGCGLMLALTFLALLLAGPPGSARVRLARRLFALGVVALGVLLVATWQGWPSLWAALGTGMVCLARWQRSAGAMRALLLASAVPWLAHDTAVGSVPGMAADLLCLAQAALLLWGRRPQPVRASLPATSAT